MQDNGTWCLTPQSTTKPGGSRWGAATQGRCGVAGASEGPWAFGPAPGAPRPHGARLEKGKSVTVCEIFGTKDASVTRKNLLWEQSCRSVIAH